MPSEPPAAPKGLTVQAKGAGLHISWNRNPAAENVTSYEIRYSAEREGPYVTIYSTDATSIDYYSPVYKGWYQVVANNRKGASRPSASVYYSGEDGENP